MKQGLEELDCDEPEDWNRYSPHGHAIRSQCTVDVKTLIDQLVHEHHRECDANLDADPEPPMETPLPFK